MIAKLKKVLRTFDGMSLAAKASIVLMMTRLITKGLHLITSPIFTRLMTTEEYGHVTNFFSWYDILITFTGLCLAKGVFHNGMVDFKKDRECFAWSAYSLAFVNSLIIGTGVTLFCAFVHNFMDLPIHLIIWMFVLLTFEEALSIWTVQQRFEYKYKAPAIMSLTLAVVSPIIGILGILCFDTAKVTARIVGAKGVFLIAYMGVAACLAYKARGKIKTAYWKYALKFNLPLIPHYLSLHILNHTDRIMIAKLDSIANAGIYGVAYNGAAMVKLFWTSVNASLIPWTYEKCEKQDFKSLSEVTNVLMMGFGMICALFMFLAPEVMKILAPASYAEGIYVIPPVIAGVFLSAMYYIFANVVYYYKKPKYVMFGSCCSAVANVALNAIFIPMFGFIAAGYTTMAAYLLQVIIDYYAMKKVVKRDIYNMKFIVGLTAMIVILGCVLSVVYEYTVLRFAILFALLAYVIYYLRKHGNMFLRFLIKKKS